MRNQLFRTRITEMLGIRHPILCGGMGPSVSDARYVAAVVNAGGMGFVVAAGFPDLDEFREQLRRCRSLTSGKGFGVNLYLSGQANATERLRQQIRILAEEEVLCVETSGGSPEDVLPALQEAGIKVLHKVPAVRYARSAARLGVDAVIVVGNDCGGHPGTYGISSMVQALDRREFRRWCALAFSVKPRFRQWFANIFQRPLRVDNADTWALRQPSTWLRASPRGSTGALCKPG
ncbi:putative enoyl-[acyl-carrier-protein] reductase II [compost metagenome]